MEIDILTTKKKLTKNILDQLERISYYDMVMFLSTDRPGYYINTPNGKVFLIETSTKWKTLKELTDFEYQEFSKLLRLNNNDYIRIYNKFVKECSKNHLIV